MDGSCALMTSLLSLQEGSDVSRLQEEGAHFLEVNLGEIAMTEREGGA